MRHARQSFSVCQFNEKYIFAFGGKVLSEGTTVKQMNKNQSFEFVSQIEVYEIEKNLWKTINYISENNKFRLLHAGTFQVTGKKIIIFGGVKPEDDSSQFPGIECGKKVSLSNETLFLNVTNGEIKSGPEMQRPSYFISGGSLFPQQGKIHVFGLSNTKETMSGLNALSADPNYLELNPSVNKKTLHFYKV